MGPRALTASSGPAPWSMAVGSYFGSITRGSRGLAPSCCLPHGRRERSPSQFLRQLKKTRGDFSIAEFFKNDKNLRAGNKPAPHHSMQCILVTKEDFRLRASSRHGGRECFWYLMVPESPSGASLRGRRHSSQE
jgi:hypothetical protein